MTVLFAIYCGIKLNKKQLIANYFDLNNTYNQNILNSSTNLCQTDDKTDETIDNYFGNRTLVSPNVDQLLQQIIDYCLRDFILIWSQTLIDRKSSEKIEIKLKYLLLY